MCPMAKRSSLLGPSVAQVLSWSWFLPDLLRARTVFSHSCTLDLYINPRKAVKLSTWGRLLWHSLNKTDINSLIICVTAFVLKWCISIIFSVMPLHSPSVPLMLHSHINLSSFRRRKRQHKRHRQSKSSAIALWMMKTLADTLYVPSLLSSTSINPAIKANGCWDNSSNSWLPTQILSLYPIVWPEV